MNRAKYIFRVGFFLLTVSFLVFLNRKTDTNARTIVEFKIKMIEKIRKDSLDSKQKLSLLIDETTKFIDDSPHVRKRIHYLVGILILWGLTELGFLILEKRNYGP